MMRKVLSNAWMGVILTGILFSLMACLFTFPTSTPTAEPIPTVTPTETPLYALATLTSVSQHEEAQGPNYTIDTQTPVLEGSDDKRVEAFNGLMSSIVQEEVDGFISWMANMPVVPVVNGSFLEIDYAQVSPAGNLTSIKFSIVYYSDGAAHPGHYSRTVTYDLEGGAETTLSQLFLPGTDYLEFISTYCIDELRKRDIGFDDLWMDGADPTPENYRNWNVTTDGLLITFDEYQVAAYAAGPQEIVIPYTALSNVLDPHSPLSEILK